MPCTKLTVPKIKQITDVMCGAACAHMILLADNVLNSVSPATQNGIWTDIQQNTGTAAAGFPLIEGCGDSPALEWATHPNALQKTLNARMNRHAADVIADTDEDAMASHALKSVKQGMPAVVLVKDTTHWIVVFGCEHSKRKKVRELIVNGDTVTHILVRDPTRGTPFAERMTLDKWASVICAVTCGRFNEKYIVVGAR